MDTHKSRAARSWRSPVPRLSAEQKGDVALPHVSRPVRWASIFCRLLSDTTGTVLCFSRFSCCRWSLCVALTYSLARPSARRLRGAQRRCVLVKLSSGIQAWVPSARRSGLENWTHTYTKSNSFIYVYTQIYYIYSISSFIYTYFLSIHKASF